MSGWRCIDAFAGTGALGLEAASRGAVDVVLVEQDGAWLATRLDPAEVSAAWSAEPALAARVLRLDPSVPLGHARDLALLSNTLPPEKHRGYAIQWFGLALATLVILIVLNLRRRP